MPDDKDVLPQDTPEQPQEGAPESPGAADSPQERRAARGQQKKRQRSVFQYIAILFAAAFVLLLYTYAMERRENDQRELESQEQIEDLDQQRVSAVQTLEGLYDENDTLKARVEALEEELKAAREASSQTAASAAQTQQKLDRTLVAMDWFWQLDEAYVRGRKNLCREIIGTMEADTADPMTNYLARESATANDRFSPYDRYMEIREDVM